MWRLEHQMSSAHQDEDARQVGVGLQPSRDDTVHRMGHMWIRWVEPSDGELHHRGYWPLLSDVPPGLSADEVRSFLITHSVRGLYRIDTDGKALEAASPSARIQNWNFSERAYSRLTLLFCWLPDGKTFRMFGMYSCSESLEDTHNCSSWAISCLRAAKEDPGFIPCDRLKRLKYVEQAIWGSMTYER